MPITYKKPNGKTLNVSQIQLAQTGQLDYCALNSDYHLGIIERIGRRSSQEDRVAISVLNDFAKQSSQQQNKKIHTAFDHAQQTYGQFHDVGSTALLCLINTNLQQQRLVIKTAHVGDSVAFLAIIDGDAIKLTRLNQQLHNPTPGSKEYQRVETIAQSNNVAGPSQYGVWRIGGLAVTRAIGDLAIEPYGLSHESDIDITEIEVAQDKDYFIIVACDGLTEPEAMIENDYQLLKTTILQHQQQPLDEFANALVQAALDAGSHDNISVIVHKPNLTGTMQKSMLGDNDYLTLAVFDGHGGDQVSEQLRQHFLDEL